ncbi:MAG: hypothetical protein ACRC6T_01545 [Sarcina sp.]
MFGELDGRTARSIRVTIIFVLLISIGGNIIFFMDRYKELGIVNFYYYRNLLACIAVVFAIATASGFEVNNSLSKKEKSKYRKNISYYIIGSIIFILIGIVESKLSNSEYMVFAGVVNAGFIMLLYFISRNIWIISTEKDKKGNKYFAHPQSYDYKVEPSWRWKLWFKPIIKSRIKDEEITSNKKVMLVVAACIIFATLSLFRVMGGVLLLVAICFTIEEIFNLNTVLVGTCMMVKEEYDSDSGVYDYSIIVTDFKNKRECEVYYGKNIPPYREGDKLRVVITLITRRKKSVRYIV